MDMRRKTQSAFDTSFISANASEDHAEHFYRLAQMAGDELYTVLFGARARAVLHAMFKLGQNEFSYRHTRFLLVEGEIAGMIHGFRAEAAQAHSARTLWLMLGCSRLQLFRFLASSIMLRDIVGFTGARVLGDFYILFVAILPRYRGQGYSRTLLAEAERLAAEQNCDRLALDVDERNAVARAAYKRAGYELIGASKKVSFDNESWRVLRLAKSVTARA